MIDPAPIVTHAALGRQDAAGVQPRAYCILNVGGTGHARGINVESTPGSGSEPSIPRSTALVCAGRCNGETLRKNTRARSEMRLEDNRDRSPSATTRASQIAASTSVG